MSATPPPPIIRLRAADVAFDPRDVLLHSLPCLLRMLLLDRLEDEPMELDRALRAAGDVVARRQGSLQERTDRVHEVNDDAVARGLGEAKVEAQIRVDEALLRSEACLHRADRSVHRAQVRIRPARRRERSALALENPPHLEELARVGLVGGEQEVQAVVERIPERGDRERAVAATLD